ncbi:hypothetical protein CKL83_11585 [Bacillus anthracis]|nr:hypothetical protein BAS3489 [Bacillus anthracis str. Sterne]APT27097.1 hypothetical protein BVB96_19080 [Bacillus anthracis]AQM47563.1 hypothetical protein BZG08_19270 [Bacillus anthracis]ASE28563.1 hypothetical protein CEQ19_05755 [Bacillus anthracis]AWU54434.1 hypothetical protein DNQ11_19130 [Bacillus anthracis]
MIRINRYGIIIYVREVRNMDWDLTEKVLRNLAYIVAMVVGIINAKKALNDIKDRKEKKKEEEIEKRLARKTRRK